MKMAAKSLPEDDEDDSWVEAEINRELEGLTIDMDALDDANTDEETDHDVTVEGENLPKEFSDVMTPALDEYISKVSRQVEMMETELRECDEVLQEAEIVTARLPQNDAFLEALAAEAGTDVHSLKQKILPELEAEEKAEKNRDDDAIDEESVVAALSTDKNHSVPQMEASTADLKDLDPPQLDGTMVTKEVLEDGAEISSDSASLVPASEKEVLDCETLEKQLRLQLRELERTQQNKEVERQQIEESLKEKENLLVKELAEERQKRLLKIEEEVGWLNEENQKREARFVEEKEMMTKRLDTSLNESKLQIERLTDRIEEQREMLKQMTEEKNLQEEQQRTISATKIQARFRGFRVRKIYGARVKEKIEEVKELRRTDRLRVIEERIKMEEDKKREEEKKKMEEEERKRRLEEEEKRRIEEEKKRKEEEVRRQKEEERLRKEEQRKAKEEAEKRKKEEDIKRKELERLKKEEEKRKKEEEKQKKKEEERKRKEEEERLKKEEQERKKAEERLRKEEEERRKAEDRKKKEEEKRQGEEAQKILNEGNSRHELNKSICGSEKLIKNEDERLEQTDAVKADGIKEGNPDQSKLETARITNTGKNSKHEPTKTAAVAEDHKLRTSQEIGSNLEESKPKSMEQKPDRSLGFVPGTQSATESLPKPSEATETKRPPVRIQQNRRFKEHNKTCDVLESVSKSVEARRLSWMKDNQSWSKSVSRQRSEKVVQSQNSLRVPSSAKNLPALDEKVILLSSKAARLNQVTAVELQDISACSLKTLSQCIHLKYLVMNNCNLIATEGLERVTGLQYVDLKNNKLEMMNFSDLINLVFLDVSKNSLRSISGLSGCKSLRYLNVSNNRITRISGLESLDRLHTLIASGNPMISTKGLADVISLQVLDLSSNDLSIVADVEHLGMLRSLDLRSNNLKTVPSLTNQVLLCDLLLDKNGLSSLTSLSQSWLPCLSHLGLSENRLSCLVDLRFCLCLQSLDLSGNLITDISSVSDGLVSCQRLERMNVIGNPVVEDTNYRNTLLSAIKSLRYLNEERQAESASVPSMEPDSWLATCLSQIDGYHHLHLDYVKSLEIAGNGLSNIFDIHERYFASSHQMATVHRFFHEYGGKILPQPPLTPKLLAIEESNSPVSFEKSPSVQEASAAQTISMKAKFEQALLSTSSSRTTQPRISAGSDRKEVTDNTETVDKRLSSEGCHENKSPVCEKPTLIKHEFDKSLGPKNSGLQSSSAASSLDIGQSSTLEAGGGGDGGGSISQLSQQPMNGEGVKVKASKEIESNGNPSKPYTGKVGYLDKAAAKIQALWRGYSFRKRLQHILNDAHLTDDVTGDIDFDDFNIDALMPNDLCGDKDFVLPPTPRNPNNGDTPGGRNYYADDHVPAHFQSSNMNFPSFPRQAWRSGATPSPLGELIPPRCLRPNPPGKPPLPPSSRLSNLSDAHSNTTAGRSVRQEKIMEEWDFKNPRTADLFLQRAKKMDPLSRKKRLTDLDPIKRLAIMRRLEEANKVPLAATVAPKRPLPRKEYFKAQREQEEQRESEVEKERHQKAEYTFEWLHTQVQHRDSPFPLKRGGSESSLPLINPASFGGKIAALACSPSLHELQSADGTSVANGSIKQRRLSFNSDKFPPLTVNSKPSSAGSSHEQSWHRSEVNQSIGWGGGKKRAHQRR